MKKILFVMAALYATAFMAGTASAETRELVEARSQGGDNSEYINQDLERETPVGREMPLLDVRLSGLVRADVQVVDQEKRGMRPGLSIFDTRRDLFILGTGTADNGISYGFEIDVGAQRGEVYIGGIYGRFSLGDT